MGYNKNENSEDLADYVVHKKQRFFVDMPMGQVGPNKKQIHSLLLTHFYSQVSKVVIPPAVTQQFDETNTQHAALLFDSSSNQKARSQRVGQMSFYVQTPNGFWDLNWFASMETLVTKSEQKNFVDTIKSIRIIPKEQPKESEQPQARTPTKEVA